MVRVSHDGFDAHDEPGVAANPHNPANLLAVGMVHTGTGQGLATYSSFDGGTSWLSNGTLPGAGPSTAADGTATKGANVSVSFNAAGEGYVAGAVGIVGQQLSGAYVWRTDDGGRHFQPPVVAIPGDADHPWVAADPTSGSPDVYVAAIHFEGSAGQLWFTRSTDSGRTFAPPRPIDPSGSPYDRLSVMAAGPHGEVSIGYYSEPPDGPNTFDVITSTDGGATFGLPVQLGVVNASQSVAGLNARTNPAITIDPRTGHIYATAATINSATGRSEVKVFASQDDGVSWSVAHVFTAPAGTTYLQPELAVNTDGQVGLSVFDVNDGRVSLAMSISSAADTSFGSLRRLTSGFNQSLGPTTASGYWIGDYQGLTATGDVFHPLWNDARTGRLELFTARVRLG
jgi:hypothetical protein